MVWETMMGVGDDDGAGDDDGVGEDDGVSVTRRYGEWRSANCEWIRMLF